MAEQQTTTASAKMPKWAWAILVIIVLLLLLSAYGEDPKVKESIRDTLAIEQCWKEYERKSLAPEEKRFIAGACEKMEAGYRMKHGRNP